MGKLKLLHVATAVTLLTSALAGEVNAAGSGGGTPTPSYDSSARGLTPEQQSERAFKAGVKARDRALKHEAKAASATSDRARQKSLGKAQKAFAKAIEKQGDALRLNPQNYQAANELGFALRKTGDYRKAIGAYNYALQINPDYHEATEYRGEAYLALGMFEQTKSAYMELFRENRELAAQLMDRFEAWKEAQNEGLDEAQSAFSAWIDERKRVADVTNDLSMNNTRAW